jgi:hypothetical protein
MSDVARARGGAGADFRKSRISREGPPARGALRRNLRNASKPFLFFAKDFFGIAKFFLGISKLFFGGFGEFQRVAREKKKKMIPELSRLRSPGNKASAREIPDRVRDLAVSVRHARTLASIPIIRNHFPPAMSSPGENALAAGIGSLSTIVMDPASGSRV